MKYIDTDSKVRLRLKIQDEANSVNVKYSITQRSSQKRLSSSASSDKVPSSYLLVSAASSPSLLVKPPSSCCSGMHDCNAQSEATHTLLILRISFNLRFSDFNCPNLVLFHFILHTPFSLITMSFSCIFLRMYQIDGRWESRKTGLGIHFDSTSTFTLT